MKTRFFIFFVLLWLGLNGISLLLQVYNAQDTAKKIAFSQGKLFFQHIVTMRHWNARHGGVYVTVTEDTPPNPYLDIPERDIVTLDGRRLTLINPAYMTRQLAELEHDKSRIQFHITSLHPKRPENKADDWETSALLAFEEGESVVMDIATLHDEPFYRYMEPLKITESCLRCHRNYQIGDIRGGISVSIPKTKIIPYVENQLSHIYLLHAVIASLGVMLLIVFHYTERLTQKQLIRAKSKLHLAYIDSLTGLPNRRYYDQYVQKEWQRALRHQYPLSIIMLDIDYFKNYNDTEGHPAGDQCLIELAKVLKLFSKRSDDFVCRYGGEEFCVVTACNAEQSLSLAEKLRDAVEKRRLRHPNSPVSHYVTLSLGVATVVPKDTLSSTRLLGFADKALYLAKQNGRNRVEQFDQKQIDDAEMATIAEI
ncbi:diguanylate cyclase [Methylotuvimicrobium buryatense]|uniref:diguanylate cyclase n=1 Tax=Methylotuvimicrobium buryatense TaxID=95641 RepID=UPI00034891C6|nr:diguanylate cyclase [Methylotuvimicrobium buryatense]